MAFFSSATIAYATSLPGFAHEIVDQDFNGDGRPDLVSVRFHYPLQDAGIAVEVLLNQGNGTFVNGTGTVIPGGAPTTTHPRQIVTADFNGDGKLDFYIADHGYDATPFPGAQNRLLLSSGSTYVDATAANLPAIVDFTHSAAAADIDGDGDQDLYVGNVHGANLVPPYFLINNGSGVFSRADNRLPVAISTLNQNTWVTAAFGDFNNDGSADLFLGSDIGNTSIVLLNNGSGSFAGSGASLPAEPFGTGSIALDSQVRDINSDGLNDLVVVFTRANYTDRSVRFWINQGNGSFVDETASRVNFVTESGAWLSRVTFADFNGDGASDLFTEQTGGDPAQILINDGDGYFFRPTNAEHTFTGQTPEVGDFTGDGRPDVVAWGGGNSLFLYTWQDGPTYPLNGGGGNDTLYGDARANAMSGAGGNDSMRGGAGNDTIDGGNGNDTLLGGSGADAVNGNDESDMIAGGAGADTLNGGGGNDTIAYHLDPQGGTARGIYVNLASSVAIDTSGSVDILSGFENITGTENAYPGGYWSDFLIGDNGANAIYGLGGTDYIVGGYGNDYLSGGGGVDWFILGGEIQGGAYDLIADFNVGGAGDYLALSAAFQSLTSFGDSGGYGYAYVNLGSSAYVVLASGVTGAQLQTQTFFS